MTEAADKRMANVLALPKLNPTRDSTLVSDHLKAFAIACQADGLRHETMIVDPRSKYSQHMTPQYNSQHMTPQYNKEPIVPRSKFCQHMTTPQYNSQHMTTQYNKEPIVQTNKPVTTMDSATRINDPNVCTKDLDEHRTNTKAESLRTTSAVTEVTSMKEILRILLGDEPMLFHRVTTSTSKKATKPTQQSWSGPIASTECSTNVSTVPAECFPIREIGWDSHCEQLYQSALDDLGLDDLGLDDLVGRSSTNGVSSIRHHTRSLLGLPRIGTSNQSVKYQLTNTNQNSSQELHTATADTSSHDVASSRTPTPPNGTVALSNPSSGLPTLTPPISDINSDGVSTGSLAPLCIKAQEDAAEQQAHWTLSMDKLQCNTAEEEATPYDKRVGVRPLPTTGIGENSQLVDSPNCEEHQIPLSSLQDTTTAVKRSAKPQCEIVVVLTLVTQAVKDDTTVASINARPSLATSVRTLRAEPPCAWPTTASPAAERRPHGHAELPGERSGSVGDHPVVDNLPTYTAPSGPNLPSYPSRLFHSDDSSTPRRDGSQIGRESGVQYRSAGETQPARTEAKATMLGILAYADASPGTHEDNSESRIGGSLVSDDRGLLHVTSTTPHIATKPGLEAELVVISGTGRRRGHVIVQASQIAARVRVGTGVHTTVDATPPDTCSNGDFTDEQMIRGEPRAHSGTSEATIVLTTRTNPTASATKLQARTRFGDSPEPARAIRLPSTVQRQVIVVPAARACRTMKSAVAHSATMTASDCRVSHQAVSSQDQINHSRQSHKHRSCWPHNSRPGGRSPFPGENVSDRLSGIQSTVTVTY